MPSGPALRLLLLCGAGQGRGPRCHRRVQVRPALKLKLHLPPPLLAGPQRRLLAQLQALGLLAAGGLLHHLRRPRCAGLGQGSGVVGVRVQGPPPPAVQRGRAGRAGHLPAAVPQHPEAVIGKGVAGEVHVAAQWGGGGAPAVHPAPGTTPASR